MPNLELGKYAVYVVPAYLISFAVVAGITADTLLRARHWRREVARREAALAKKEAPRMKRLLPLIPIVVILALGILFAGYGLHHDPQVQPNALIGKSLPTQVLPPLDGGAPIRVSSALKGPGLVNVFGSWCGPCAVEAPQMMKLKANGVQMVGVSWRDTPGNAQAFLERTGNPFGLVLVGTEDTAVEFGITGAPETFVVDGKGKVVDKRVGPLSDVDVATLTRQLKTLE